MLELLRDKAKLSTLGFGTKLAELAQLWTEVGTNHPVDLAMLLAHYCVSETETSRRNDKQ